MPVEEEGRVVSLVVLKLGMNGVAWKLTVARLGSSPCACLIWCGFSFFFCPPPGGYCCTWPTFFFFFRARLVGTAVSCWAYKLVPVAGEILACLGDPGDWIHWTHGTVRVARDPFLSGRS